MSPRQNKRNPDEAPKPHQIDDAKRAADAEQIEEAFVTPQDGLDRIDELGVETPAEDVEKGIPEVVDELDHAGLEDSPPVDHPDDREEEPPKDAQTRWG